MERTAAIGTLVAASLGFSVIQLDVSVVNVAVRPIGADLGGDVDALQWIVNAYTIAFAALILSAGALADRIGARRTFLGGFALFVLASLACAAAPTLTVLVAARGLQGVGAALLAPASLSLINHAFEPRERAHAVGLYLAGASVALAGGPLVGGVLTEAVSWRAIFAINLPLGALGALLTLRWAAETTRSPDRRPDLPGQAAAVVALVALAAATIEGGAVGFTAPGVLAGYAVALVAGLAFVLVEHRVAQPMLPPALFRVGGFGPTVLAGLCINTAGYGLLFVLSLWFQDALGMSPLQAGLAFVPTTLAIGAANVLAGRLDARLGTGRTVALGALVLGLSALGLLWTGADTPYAAAVAQLALFGAGLGTVVPALTARALGSVDASRSGVASGTFNTARQSGSVIGVAAFGSLVAAQGLIGGLHTALLAAAVLAAVVVGVGVGLARAADAS